MNGPTTHVSIGLSSATLRYWWLAAVGINQQTGRWNSLPVGLQADIKTENKEHSVSVTVKFDGIFFPCVSSTLELVWLLIKWESKRVCTCLPISPEILVRVLFSKSLLLFF